jgi:feruloyl esterase
VGRLFQRGLIVQYSAWVGTISAIRFGCSRGKEADMVAQTTLAITTGSGAKATSNKRANVTARLLASLAFFPGVILGIPAAAATCETLVLLSLPETIISSAVSVPGPSFAAPNGQTYSSLPPFCKVSATLTPTPDSLINVELWMPTTSWNGRFEGTGNGGYAGTIALSVPAMVSGLQAGFAVAGTDMGTAPSANNDADALVGHPQKWVDWGYRATHLMTAVSKQIIQVFYGRGPRYSYFNGCSTGGQQALMEAQRFAADYDGILGGDPANNRTHVHTAIVWNYRAMHATPLALFTSDKAQLVTNAVLAACAVASGGLAADPFLTDPRACNWDPGALQCSSVTSTNCLTPDQVAAARAMYAGATDLATRHLIFPGSVRGSESDGQFGWTGIGSQPEPPFDSLFKWVFGSTWLWPTFDFDQDMASVDALLAPILNANSADLSEFQARGGRLLMYHGWADPLISPQDSIDHYLRVVAAQPDRGAAALKHAQGFYRLFMVPGMYHCAFGPGPNAFGNLFSGQVYAAPPPVHDATHDAFVALQQWVEHGVAPERLVATKYIDDVPSLGVQMTRPLCAFPKVPRYSGTGNTKDAANFVCVTDNNANNPMPAPEYLQ